MRPFNGSITKSDILSELCAVEKLCQGHHPNIIRVFEHGRLNPKNSAYYIDMELCDLTLEDYTWGTKFVPSLPNWKTAKETNTTVTLIVPIMRQIADGVAFIHSHDQVHRDLKPSNSKIPEGVSAELCQFCIQRDRIIGKFQISVLRRVQPLLDPRSLFTEEVRNVTRPRNFSAKAPEVSIRSQTFGR